MATDEAAMQPSGDDANPLLATADDVNRYLVWAMLAVVLIAGVAVRAWQIDESLWLDELHTAWVVDAGLSQIAPRARTGNQSPLYFILPWMSRTALGDHAWALRLPSLVAGCCLILAMYRVVRIWSESALAALGAAALVCVDQRAIFYAQEARPYALVELVAMGHVFLFWQLQTKPDAWRRGAVILLALVLFWLHYTTALLLVAEFAWYVFQRIRRTTKYQLLSATLDAMLFGVGTVPALPHVREIAGRSDSWSMFVGQQPPRVVANWFQLDLYVLAPLVTVAGLFWIGSLFGRRVRLRAGAAGVWTLTVAWFVIPVATAWFLTSRDITPLLFPRYLLPSSLAPIVLAGMLIGSLPLRITRGMASVGLVLGAVTTGGMIAQFASDGRFLTDRNQDWRGAVSWINRSADSAAQPVLLRSGLIEADRLPTDSSVQLHEYCLAPITGLYKLQANRSLIPLPTSRAGKLDPETAAALVAAEGFWLVVNGGPNSQSQILERIRQSLQPYGDHFSVERQSTFGSVQVTHVELR